MSQELARSVEPMDDEERVRLAAKLEADLEEWVDSLPKTPYKDGWPEDRWEEEMDKHPFFMKQAPDLSKGDLPPLIQGLANLKFDPDNNTPLELALNYKEDGNFYYKNKNYRLSVVSYTEGIKVECEESTVNVALYNNRAQSHYMLENYRLCLRDCQKVLQMDSHHRKSLSRAARCAFKLLDFDLCVLYCSVIISLGKNSMAEKLKSESEKILYEMKADNQRKSQVLEHIKNNGIKMYDPTTDDESHIELFFSGMPDIEMPAHLDETNSMIWPIIILYPEFQIYDYYQEFSESRQIGELIDEVLAEIPSWDLKGMYKPDAVVTYYIGKNLDNLHCVNLNKTLIEIMQEKNFMLRQFAPTFIVKLKTKL